MRSPGLRPQPEDMLEDATQGGARAVRQGTRLGSLEVGKKADLIVLDTQRAHLVPAGRIVSAWIHNGQPSDIESVMVDGQFIMRNRKVLTMDEDASSPKPTRSGGGSGIRCWQPARFRCRADRASTDNRSSAALQGCPAAVGRPEGLRYERPPRITTPARGPAGAR